MKISKFCPFRAAACLFLAFASACSSSGSVARLDTGSPGKVAPKKTAKKDLSRVAGRVLPAARALCREELPDAPDGYCKFGLTLNDDMRLPPNAFQSYDAEGAPRITITASMLEMLGSDDEMAAVLAHEAAHHIAQHNEHHRLDRSGGALTYASKSTQVSGSQEYSRAHEFEADRIGAFVSARAGFNPVEGARILDHPALFSAPADAASSSHPATSERKARVVSAYKEIHRQNAAGQTPRP